MPMLLAAVPPVILLLVLLVGLTVLVMLLLFVPLFTLWIQSLTAGAPVSILELIGMRLRRVNPRLIVLSRIMAVRAGLQITTPQLENHYLAGGRPMDVVRALIAAKHADVDLSWEQVTALDLAGRDVGGLVESFSQPMTLECGDPQGGGPKIQAVSRDGVPVTARLSVTVRVVPARLLNDAAEQTIRDRVTRAAIEAIGAADSAEIRADPDAISARLLHEGLDEGTAYEIHAINLGGPEFGQGAP